VRAGSAPPVVAGRIAATSDTTRTGKMRRRADFSCSKYVGTCTLVETVFLSDHENDQLSWAKRARLPRASAAHTWRMDVRMKRLERADGRRDRARLGERGWYVRDGGHRPHAGVR
jgi:hypothetical protein